MNPENESASATELRKQRLLEVGRHHDGRAIKVGQDGSVPTDEEYDEDGES